MPRRRILRLTLPLAACLLLPASRASAQSRGRCSPAYTGTDEFKEMIGEKVFPKIVIDDVRIEGATNISQSVLQDVIDTIQRQEFNGGEKWLEEIEDSIRLRWQDQGFFKVLPAAVAHLLYGNSTLQHFSVIVHVDEDLQYRLGTVRFVATPVAVEKVGFSEKSQKSGDRKCLGGWEKSFVELPDAF